MIPLFCNFAQENGCKTAVIVKIFALFLHCVSLKGFATTLELSTGGIVDDRQ